MLLPSVTVVFAFVAAVLTFLMASSILFAPVPPMSVVVTVPPTLVALPPNTVVKLSAALFN